MVNKNFQNVRFNLP